MKFTYYLKVAVCACLTAFISCNNKKQNVKTILDEAKAVSSKVISHDFLLGNPYQIGISNDILLIADSQDDKALILYDIKNNLFLGHRLGIGQGPNEILPPLLLGKSNETGIFSVFQRRIGKHARYELSDFVEGVIIPKDTLRFENADRITQTSNGYIVAGEYPEGSIRLLDNKGKPLNEIDIYPQYIHDLKSIADKYIYGQGSIVFNKKSNVLAFAASFTGEALFHHLDDESLSELQSYDFSLSSKLKNHISGTSSTARIGDTDIQYFADIFSTSDYFYLLYSGVPMKDRRTTPFSYIFKFSSKGEFIESYKTDIKLLAMCVANDDTKIYGIGLSQDFDYVLVEVGI